MATKRFHWHPGLLMLSVTIAAGSKWIGLPLWLGLLLGVVPYVLAISSEAGVEFSSDGRQVREYQRVLGLKIGGWTRLPPVTGITIKYFSEICEANKGRVQTWEHQKIQHKEWIIMLSLSSSSTGFIVDRYPVEDLAAARQAAEALAERFGGVPVREYLVPQRTGRR